MKWISMIVVLGLSQSTLAFFPTAEVLKGLEKKVTQYRQAKRPSKKTNQCANFSGNWVGICELPGGKKEVRSFTIEQNDCGAIILTSAGGKSELLDLSGVGIKSEASSGAYLSYTHSTAAKWSSDKNVIQLVVNGVFNSVVFDAPGNYKVKGQMLLQGDELLQFYAVEGLSEGDGESACRMQKK